MISKNMFLRLVVCFSIFCINAGDGRVTPPAQVPLPEAPRAPKKAPRPLLVPQGNNVTTMHPRRLTPDQNQNLNTGNIEQA